jgi:hypothetical protein
VSEHGTIQGKPSGLNRPLLTAEQFRSYRYSVPAVEFKPLFDLRTRQERKDDAYAYLLYCESIANQCRSAFWR